MMTVKRAGLWLGLSALALLFLSVSFVGAKTSPDEGRVLVYFFRGEGCPYCAREEKFLEQLKEKYPGVEVRDFEVWNHPENRSIFRKMLRGHGVDRESVPVTFIGLRHWVGFSQVIKKDMVRSVRRNLPGPGLDPARGIIEPEKLSGSDTPATENTSDPAADTPQVSD